MNKLLLEAIGLYDSCIKLRDKSIETSVPTDDEALGNYLDSIFSYILELTSESNLHKFNNDYTLFTAWVRQVLEGEGSINDKLYSLCH